MQKTRFAECIQNVLHIPLISERQRNKLPTSITQIRIQWHVSISEVCLNMPGLELIVHFL